MTNIIQSWQTAKFEYQQRYVRYMKGYLTDESDKISYGHAMECSYVLIGIFGLTNRQMAQLERNNWAGLLDEDIEGRD